MSAQTSGIRARVASGLHGKYQLDVTARDVTELVQHAGGWLYDRSMAGWAVRVTLASHDADVTALRILGLGTEWADTDTDTGADSDSGATPTHALALAASADALAADPALRADVLRAMNRGLVEVTLWGGSTGAAGRSDPTRQFGVNGANGFDGRVEVTEHVLSAAARAFKAHALRAAGVNQSVGPVETFLRRPTAYVAS